MIKTRLEEVNEILGYLNSRIGSYVDNLELQELIEEKVKFSIEKYQLDKSSRQ